MSRTHHPKKCQFCGKVFNPKHAETVFCSRQCHFDWRKRETKRRNEKIAAHLGISVRTLKSRISHKQISLGDYLDYNNLSLLRSRTVTAPKPYWKIQLENRCRSVQSGWRGQPVIGGGRGINTNAPLTPVEMQASCRWRY